MIRVVAFLILLSEICIAQVSLNGHGSVVVRSRGVVSEPDDRHVESEVIFGEPEHKTTEEAVDFDNFFRNAGRERPPQTSVKNQVAQQPSTDREWWLVTEWYCTACPAAKASFLSSGGREDHIITSHQAMMMHGVVVEQVPYFYYTYQNSNQQRVSQNPVALWEGKSYSGRVCNNPNCTMCNSIDSQIQSQLKSLSAPTLGVPLPELPSDMQPSLPAVISEALRKLQLNKSSLVADLGCGDARVLIQAVRDYDCHGVGYEIDEKQVERARAAVSKAEASGEIPRGRILIVNQDVSQLGFLPAKVDAVFCYQSPKTLVSFRHLLVGRKNVASSLHHIPGIPMRRGPGELVWTPL